MIAVLVHVQRQFRIAGVVVEHSAVRLDVAFEIRGIADEGRGLDRRPVAERPALDPDEAQLQPGPPGVLQHQGQHRPIDVLGEIGARILGRLRVRRFQAPQVGEAEAIVDLRHQGVPAAA